MHVCTCVCVCAFVLMCLSVNAQTNVLPPMQVQVALATRMMGSIQEWAKVPPFQVRTVADLSIASTKGCSDLRNRTGHLLPLARTQALDHWHLR